MPVFNILPFQKTTIDELNESFLRLWKKKGRQLPLVFKSPTGSGKTLTIAHFIKGLNHLPQWKRDKALLLAGQRMEDIMCVGKGEKQAVFTTKDLLK